MSMPDITDEFLLGDDDELDYDLEKDEEEALLADPESYEHEEQHYEPEDHDVHEDTEDVLDIDANVALDESEDFGSGNRDPHIKQENVDESYITSNFDNYETSLVKRESDDCPSDSEKEDRERNRFTSERNNVVQRPTSTNIPDSLDKVSVNPMNQNQKTNNQNNRNNGRFRGNNTRGRGRGRGNGNNRGPVFSRVGILPAEGKTVLINPHFRGNVQANNEARLVWDATAGRGGFQQRFSNPTASHQQHHPQPHQPSHQQQQFQPPVWANQQFEGQAFGQGAYAEPSQPQTGAGFSQTDRHVFSQQSTQMADWGLDQSYSTAHQGNFRVRDVRFILNAPPPLLSQTVHQNFNQQGGNFQRPNPNYTSFNDNRNQIKPFSQNHMSQPPPSHPIQQNYPPNQQQNYGQSFANQSHYPPQLSSQPEPNFQQNYNQHYESFEPPNQFNDQPNQFHSPPNAFANQNSYNQNFDGQQNSFEPLRYNNHENNERHGFNDRQFYNETGRGVAQQHSRQNRIQTQNFSPIKRTPPKRRGMENAQAASEMHKKKRRSLELANLHEVPTVDNVDMPDSTFVEEKVQEVEDEETKVYRKKIEEQKKLREKILQQKEERRKYAAAQMASNLIDVQACNNSFLTTIIQDSHASPVSLVNQSNQPIIAKQQQVQHITSIVTKQQPVQQSGARIIQGVVKLEVGVVGQQKGGFRQQVVNQRQEGGVQQVTAKQRLGAKQVANQQHGVGMQQANRRQRGNNQGGAYGNQGRGVPNQNLGAVQQGVFNQNQVQQGASNQRQGGGVQPGMTNKKQGGGVQQGVANKKQGVQQGMISKKQGGAQQGVNNQQQGGIQQGVANQQRQGGVINQIQPFQQSGVRPGFQQQGIPQSAINNSRFNKPRTNMQNQQQKRNPAVIQGNMQRQQHPVNIRANAQNQQNIIQVQQEAQPCPQINPVQQRIGAQTETQPQLLIVQQNELATSQTQRRVVLKQGVQKSQTANRRVVLKSANAETVSQPTELKQEENLSSFLTNRKVITNTILTGNAAGIDLGQGTLIKTPVVTVGNLAAGTTEVKIRKLCQGLGPIQTVQMIPNSRQATIRFKNIVSAHKFFKKYQRKIIDLSMIQVTLEAIS